MENSSRAVSIAFVEGIRLGVMEPQFIATFMTPVQNKKLLKSDFARFARLVRDLKLVPIPKGGEVHSISYGLTALGERGLFIGIEVPLRVDATLPGETP